MGKGKGKGQAKAVVEERGFGAYPQYGQQAYPQGYPAYNQPPPGKLLIDGLVGGCFVSGLLFL
jgi:hypothetical protein